MKTVRRMLYRDIVQSVVFVAVAFLSLFFFIDFVDELENVGKRGFGVEDAFASSLLDLPNRLYELLPIAVLIGTIFSLARLAQSSEYTILRTAGLGPGRALRMLTALGLAFALVTVLVGEVVAPLTSRAAVALKARFGGRDLGGAGAWLRDERQADDGVRQVSVNVRRVGSGGKLEGIRLFEYDSERRLRTRLQARTGDIDPKLGWQLEQVVLTQWSVPREPRPVAPGADVQGPEAPQDATRVEETRHDTLTWPTALTEDVVAAAVLPPSSMSTLDLWRYSTHLSDREQSSARYAIQFWKKALYPFACLVMVALALPFAYLSARAGGISLKVFGGIMLGISFVLLNSVSGHLGVLRDWTPWMAAAVPSVVYILMSMAAFAWLVRYR
jgi:lipopolysaccharide export system permease protein